MLTGDAESDTFGALVLNVSLGWREVALLRAYSRYMRQIGTLFSHEYIASVLNAHTDVAGALVAYFRARFDPDITADERERARRPPDAKSSSGWSTRSRASTTIGSCAASPPSWTPPCARTGSSAMPPAARRRTSSTSSTPHAFPTSRDPSPPTRSSSPHRVEAVHLRMGKVARGGLRWSDRREDFRTEVLGLVKAQTVKNAVIVPTGAKGGFVPKRLPPITDRDAWLAEGTDCYRTFVGGLLDVTDNNVTPADSSQHAASVTRRRPRRTLRRRRPISRGRSRQGHGHVFRHRQRDRGGSRILAGRRVRVRWQLGLRPQGNGHHGSRRVGIGACALPRARHRPRRRRVHRGRRRRHVRRRVRQRHVALAPAPPRRGVRPSARVPRPRARPFGQLRRAAAALRAPAFVMGRLRRVAISDGGGVYARTVKSVPITPAVRAAFGPARRRRRAEPARTDQRDPCRAGRPPVERRYRHLSAGINRIERRRRRQGERCRAH